MKTLKFTTNWNNKLECKYFTTLRISNKFDAGDKIIILFDNKFKLGHVIEKKKIQSSQLNDFLCYIDTGYNFETTKDMIMKMYNIENWKSVNFLYLYLIHSTEKFQDFTPENEVLDLI